jgi:hypothetical protein
MTTFLAQGYKYKEIDDYGIGAEAIVTMSDAQTAMQSAGEFLAHIEALLA